MLTFNTFASAKSFCRGYCVPRCVVQLTKKQAVKHGDAYMGRFGICTPSTAKRRGFKVVYGN